MTTLDKTALEAATAEWLNWTDRTAGEGLADHLARAITAYLDALSSLPAQAVGVKLVPLEPTQEMINAGLKRNAQNPHPWLPAVYRAMIALAPSQPAAVGKDEQRIDWAKANFFNRPILSEQEGMTERADALWEQLLPFMQVEECPPGDPYKDKVAALALIEAALVHRDQVKL